MGCPAPVTPPPPEVDAGVPAFTLNAPAPPRLGPCAKGWREQVLDGGDERWCEPWPEGGRQSCASPAFVHFPGEPGCARLGSACPSGEWPEGLPDASVLYVRAGAGDGGVGSTSAPFGTIAEALAVAPAGSVVALGAGTFDEAVRLKAGVTLWGACVEGTVVTSSTPSESAGVLTPLGKGTAARNLTVSGRRPGVWVGAGASIHLEDVLVDGATFGGWILVSGGAGSAQGLVIRDTRSRERDLKFGQALHLEGAGAVEVRRAVFEKNRDIGASSSSGSARLELTDVAILDTDSRELDGVNGRGLNLQGGATATLTRVIFERHRDFALVVQGGGSALTGTDVVLRDTTGLASTGAFGRGVDVQAGSRISLSRALVERSREVGVFVGEPGAVAELTDVVVRDTDSQASDGTFGRGLHAQDGAQVTVTRGRFSRNREAGVFADGAGTRLTLADLVIEDTVGRAQDATAGAGLTVQAGAGVELTRAVLSRNRRGGVFAMEPGSWARLVDLAVLDTRVEDCAATTCAALPFGTGLGSYQGAAIELRRFLVSKSALCGLQPAEGGTLVAEEGEVRGNAIGACVTDSSFDVGQISNRVDYVDNGLRLDSRALPLPKSLTSR